MKRAQLLEAVEELREDGIGNGVDPGRFGKFLDVVEQLVMRLPADGAEAPAAAAEPKLAAEAKLAADPKNPA